MLMTEMTEYTKNIFNDEDLLREKMKMFLGTRSASEINSYARACEKFFINGGRQHLKFTVAWNWSAFIFTTFFFLYMKDYLGAVICFVLSILLSLVLTPVFGTVVAMSVAGACAKYSIARRFVTLLNYEDDEVLKLNSGKNTWVIAGLLILGLLGIVAGVMGSLQ